MSEVKELGNKDYNPGRIRHRLMPLSSWNRYEDVDGTIHEHGLYPGQIGIVTDPLTVLTDERGTKIISTIINRTNNKDEDILVSTNVSNNQNSVENAAYLRVGSYNKDLTEVPYKDALKLIPEPNTILGGMICKGEIITSHLHNASNISDKPLGITAAKIENGAVTGIKLHDATNDNSPLGITENKIENGAVTNDKLGVNAVDDSKIKDGVITGIKLVDTLLSKTSATKNGLSAKLEWSGTDRTSIIVTMVDTKPNEAGTADTAKKTAGTLALNAVNLAGTDTGSFNGSKSETISLGVTGTLGLDNGGTGKSGLSAFSDSDSLVLRYNPSDDTTKYGWGKLPIDGIEGNKHGTNDSDKSGVLYTATGGTVKWGTIDLSGGLISGILSTKHGGTGTSDVKFNTVLASGGDSKLVSYRKLTPDHFQAPANSSNEKFSYIIVSDGDVGVKWSNAVGTANYPLKEIYANTVYTISDESEKDSIELFNYNECKSILDLPIITYKYKGDDKLSIGCTAQELLKLEIPGLVNIDNKVLSIEESKLVYPLLLEVRKLRDKLLSLEARII